MKIQVKTVNLKTELKESLEEHEKDLKKAFELYLKKQQEYLKYLEKYVSEGDFKKDTKYPPAQPHWQGKQMENTLEVLELHINEEITLDTTELASIKENIRFAKAGYTNTINSLSNSIYD